MTATTTTTTTEEQQQKQEQKKSRPNRKEANRKCYQTHKQERNEYYRKWRKAHSAKTYTATENSRH